MPNVGKAAKRHPSSLMLVRLTPNPSSNISVNIVNIIIDIIVNIRDESVNNSDKSVNISDETVNI